MNEVFFTSDTHYHHANVILYSQRPYSSVEEMNEKLIQNHNAVVHPGSRVFFLGDFSFGNEEKTYAILRRLNGDKHLILGNHDKNLRKKTKSFIGSGLFSTIQDYKELKINEQFIVLFHYGCRTWNKAHRGSWLLHGHSHGSLPPFGKSVDVGVDAKFINEEYRPVEFAEVKEFMDKQTFQSVDHHVE